MSRSSPITPAQHRVIIDALGRGELQKDIAARLGLTQPTISRIKSKLDAMEEKGRSTLRDSEGVLLQEWVKTRLRGREPEDRVHIVDPKKVVSTATLFDQAGRVSQQWVREKPDDALRESLWRIAAEEIAREVTPLPEIAPLKLPRSVDLNALYVLSDYHLGMYAVAGETGTDWNLDRAERMMRSAFDHLIASTPASDAGTLIVLGDLLHSDGLNPETPQSRHLLDMSAKFPDVVRAAVRLLRYAIDRLLAKHQTLRVVIEPGNHDRSSLIILRELIAVAYEQNPRLVLNMTDSKYHCVKWEQNFVGITHGDGIRPDRLPGIFSTDFAPEWGQTTSRMILTGHVHHKHINVDHPGCSVESFRVLCPVDSWAHRHGYRSRRDMCAIVLHAKHGEVARHTFASSMFEEPR